MITKINKIKNLGLVFSDYTRPTELPYFKHCNVIYGWNGCGKTTFSRLFDELNDPKGGVEYEIELDDTNKYKQNSTFPKKIRVFNQDYIDRNISILESKANSISILLGDENQELIQEIENDRKLLSGDAEKGLPGKLKEKEALVKNNAKNEKERGERFTEIAKAIGIAIGGNALRDYKKPQAERDFETITRTKLSEKELEKNLEKLKQQPLQNLSNICFSKVEKDEKKIDLMVFLKSLYGEANTLLRKTVESESIPRLADNGDIASWVETGLHLHSKYLVTICEYCQQNISTERTNELMRHFNEADKRLKEEADRIVENLRVAYNTANSVSLLHSSVVYSDLREEYEAKKQTFENDLKTLLENITQLAEEIKLKKQKTTEIQDLVTELNFTDLFSSINETIQKHNTKTEDFTQIRELSTIAIKGHYLQGIEEIITEFDTEITKDKESLGVLVIDIDEISERIEKNLQLVSSDLKACGFINEKLETFLGHNELKFLGNESEPAKGYQIMRGGVTATKLSEGEKTAIAFLYFVVHLGDQNFGLKDGIVVIDDPISSLDSNSIYQAFSFLKNSVASAKQLFILTHNFEFLKLLLNWRKGTDRRGQQTTYLMIKNRYSNDKRCAYLDEMDKELREYESEYHYLFKKLKELRIEQDGTIARAYPIPNIARKVWDTFLMFSVPSGENPYQKIERLKTKKFDPQKLDAIYKFVNNQSHITGAGFDPALVPETKKVIDALFEMMELISPDHYKIIDEVTN